MEGAAAAPADGGPAGAPAPAAQAVPAPPMQGVLAAVIALLADKDVKVCLVPVLQR
jgi:hypothetical protein